MKASDTNAAIGALLIISAFFGVFVGGLCAGIALLVLDSVLKVVGVWLLSTAAGALAGPILLARRILRTVIKANKDVADFDKAD